MGTSGLRPIGVYHQRPTGFYQQRGGESISYNPEVTRQYYDQLGDAEYERFDTSPVQRVKLALHMRCLRRFIEPGSRVLEIGAGPGRFTQALADLGCRVVVNDISPTQLRLNQERAQKNGYSERIEQWLLADMCDLAALGAETFDAVLAFGGPFSYLFERRDLGLSQCLAHLKPNGHLLLSVMSLYGATHAFLDGVLELPPEAQDAIFASGDITPETSPSSRHHCHMFTSDELQAFLESHDLAIEFLSASNTLSTGWDDVLSEIEEAPESWARLIEKEEIAGQSPGCQDMGTHIIAVARRI